MWPVLTKEALSRFDHFWHVGTVTKYTKCKFNLTLNQSCILKDNRVVVSCSRTVKWRTQCLSLTSLPAARIGPSDLSPLLWERVAQLCHRGQTQTRKIRHGDQNGQEMYLQNKITQNTMPTIRRKDRVPVATSETGRTRLGDGVAQLLSLFLSGNLLCLLILRPEVPEFEPSQEHKQNVWAFSSTKKKCCA